MKGRFSPEQASELRHELRTVLNQVGGYCGLARDECDGAPQGEIAERLERIRENVEAMLDRLGTILSRDREINESCVRELAAATDPFHHAIAANCRELLRLTGGGAHQRARLDVGRIEDANRRWSERLREAVSPKDESC
jgi:signal transduction histidine kinase